MLLKFVAVMNLHGAGKILDNQVRIPNDLIFDNKKFKRDKYKHSKVDSNTTIQVQKREMSNL
jgi:hypothetical protein